MAADDEVRALGKEVVRQLLLPLRSAGDVLPAPVDADGDDVGVERPRRGHVGVEHVEVDLGAVGHVVRSVDVQPVLHAVHGYAVGTVGVV